MRDSFVFYRNFFTCIEKLPESEQREAYRAIANYALNGEEAELSGMAQIIYEMAKPNIDSNNKRYKNGCKGGRPKDEDSPRKIFEDYETVILTESQWEKIVAKRGEELALAMVKILDNWLSLNGTTAKQYVGKNNYGHFKGDGWVLNEAKKLVEQESASKQPNWSV